MKKPTMICIEKDTAEGIKKLKLTKLESYNEIIGRLIHDQKIKTEKKKEVEPMLTQR